MSKLISIRIPRLSKQFYLLGLLSMWLLVITAQLLWLFDPWHIRGVYWIGMIENLWLLTVIPMMLWGIGALLGVYSVWTTEQQFNTHKYIDAAIQVLLTASCLFASCLIVFNRDAVVLLAIISGLILCFVGYELGIRYRAWKTVGISFTIGIIFLIPLPYTVTTPGLTMDMNEYAQVESGHVHAEIQGVLVFERPAFVIDFLYARIFPAYDIARIISTDPSLGEQLQQVSKQKSNANQIATAVALHKLGIGLGNKAHGIQILGILTKSPADGVLAVDDVIIAMNQQSIQNTEQFIATMQTIKPFDAVALTVVRNQQTITFQLTTQASEKNMDKAIIGVQITDHVELDIPLDVQFHSYWLHKGGPSHGAMLTLAIMDQLTPGGLTNGHRVAGTGTINIQGKVGPIGGLKQKTYTIARSNADVFFVPFDQQVEAIEALSTWNRAWSHPYKLQIVPVKTIDDMLSWLKDHPV